MTDIAIVSEMGKRIKTTRARKNISKKELTLFQI